MVMVDGGWWISIAFACGKMIISSYESLQHIQIPKKSYHISYECNINLQWCSEGTWFAKHIDGIWWGILESWIMRMVGYGWDTLTKMGTIQCRRLRHFQCLGCVQYYQRVCSTRNGISRLLPTSPKKCELRIGVCTTQANNKIRFA